MTESMMRELAIRLAWRSRFELEVDEYCPDPTHDPIEWSDALGYLKEGYSPRDAARMYCERRHIGINS